VRGDALRALWAEAVPCVVSGKPKGEFVREGCAEEGMEFERRLFDEAGSEGRDGAWLEVDGVEIFGEEGYVLWRERVRWERWCDGRRVRMKCS
jgi:hypothetical protein